VEYKDIGMCFVCGEKNERGLKLSFEFDRERKRIKTVFKPQEWQQGFEGIIHGGFLATLLDEVMVKLSYEIGIPAVTAEMNIRFIEPTRIDKDIIVTGEIMRETKRIIYTKANAQYRDPSLRSGSPSPEERSDEGREGKIVAEAEGKLVRVR
jgi:uncharacterized protein (TIGR00369 family)